MGNFNPKTNSIALTTIIALTININYLLSQESNILEDFKNNKDIGWIGEYESYMPFEISSDYVIKDSTFNESYKWILNSSVIGDYRTRDVYDQEFQKILGLESFTVVKLKEMCDPNYLNKKNNSTYNNYYSATPMIYYLYYPVKEGIVIPYKDADLKEKFNQNEIKNFGVKIDTIYTVDPLNFEEKMEVIISELDPIDIKFTKVKYYIYYNTKANIWNIYIKSIAPVKSVMNEMGDLIGYSELFWLPVDNISKIIDYTAANILYAKETRTRVNFEKSKKIKEINSYQEYCEMYLTFCKQNASKLSLFHGHSYNYPMDESEIKNLGLSIDTVYQVDPITFEETKLVVKRESNFKDLDKIDFIQNWYWDKNKNRLQVLPLYFAPTYDYRDDNENLKYTASLFLQKLSKTKSKKIN
jgi:hypothetical protein